VDAKPVVLIVEDDFLVRIFADEIAVEAGFNTLAAAEADELSAFCRTGPTTRGAHRHQPCRVLDGLN
jgi:hypothetical protein